MANKNTIDEKKILELQRQIKELQSKNKEQQKKIKTFSVNDKKYKQLQIQAKTNKNVKKVLDRNETIVRMENIIKGAKISMGMFNAKEIKINDSVKSLLPDFLILQRAF